MGIFIFFIVFLVTIFLLCAYWGKAFSGVAITLGLLLFYFSLLYKLHIITTLAWCVYSTILIITYINPIRRRLFSKLIFTFLKKSLPQLGDSEKIALESGTVWFEKEFFSGNPNWKWLLDYKITRLSNKELDFLNGPVEELCQMIDDWKILKNRDLTPEIWAYIKQHRFLGMIIPEEYDGLGFTSAAHSAVIAKIASRSFTVAVTVMVPNSLGPAELILHYGTQKQKEFYLPRLALGEEIPCFALTEPNAGSDAGSITSSGIICRENFNGQEELGIRLNWNKRYITLGPVCTIIGLAFRLYDPEELLNGKKDYGITCALIPSHLSGINIGKRHDPMGVPFQNGPNQGKDVFVPLDYIIGGQGQAGKGWGMLMETLSVGRSISLPAVSVAAIQLATRTISSYCTVRKQFNTQIGKFEGVQEPLARLGAMAYATNATRLLTVAAVDRGERPAVISAIAKCYLTNIMRDCMNDALDIHAGAAICLGPRNILANSYMTAPIGITVEGSNILTRSMIIYGQGVTRCHPYINKIMTAIMEDNTNILDKAFIGYLNFIATNAVRTFINSITKAYLIHVKAPRIIARYLQQLTQLSSSFALLSDAALISLGGNLKRKEKISGRMSDALAWLYICSATIKHFHDGGYLSQHEPFLHWNCQNALYKVQTALSGIIENLPSSGLVRKSLKMLVFPLGLNLRPPSDKLGSEIANSLLDNPKDHLQIAPNIFTPPKNEIGRGKLEGALPLIISAYKIQERIHEATRSKKIKESPNIRIEDTALSSGIISKVEYDEIMHLKLLYDEIIQVDAFTPQEFLHQGYEKTI